MNTKQALKLATDLKNKYGLREWCVKLTGSKFYFGKCCYSERCIRLSRLLVELNNEHTVRDTILHEIAHAILPMCGHNTAWRKLFISMGGNGERCYNSSTTILPPANYAGVCPNGHTATRYRMSKRTVAMACTKCCRNYSNGKYDPKFMFNWKKAKK